MAREVRRRDVGLDVLRSAAIVMVAIIHVSSASVTSGVGDLNWWGSLFWASAAPSLLIIPLSALAVLLPSYFPSSTNG